MGHVLSPSHPSQWVGGGARNRHTSGEWKLPQCRRHTAAVDLLRSRRILIFPLPDRSPTESISAHLNATIKAARRRRAVSISVRRRRLCSLVSRRRATRIAHPGAIVRSARAPGRNPRETAPFVFRGPPQRQK